MNGFDLKTAGQVSEREDKGRDIHILDELRRPMFFGDPPKPVTIRVVGTYSNVYRRAVQAMQDRRLKAASSGAALPSERAEIELLVECVIGWDGFFHGQKAAECNSENVATVLEKAPWIAAQVERATRDHEGFSESSSAS